MHTSHKPACTIGFGLFIITLLIFAYDTQHGFTRLIQFGDQFDAVRLDSIDSDHTYTLQDSSGYDAQFYAQMAIRPLVNDTQIIQAVDNPQYRFRRILLSWIAYIGGHGNPTATLNAYALLNPLFWFLFSILLFKWLPPHSWKQFLCWAACIFNLGIITSIRLSLLELPGFFFVLLCVYLTDQNRPKLGAISSACSILTKDVFAINALVQWKTLTFRSYILTTIIAFVPYLLWLIYLSTLGLPINAGSGNFALPFHALWHEVMESLQMARQDRYSNIIALLSLSIQSVYLLSHIHLNDALSRIALVNITLMTVLGESVWEGDPGAAFRILLPIGIIFNIKIIDAPNFWLLFLFGNASIYVSFNYLIHIIF